MATDIERLVVQLSADVKKYENALNRAMGQTNRQARRIESRFDRMNKNISRSFSALGRGMAVAFAVAGSARGAQNLIDSATKINNALKVAGLSGKELESVYQALFASAQKNAAPLETLVTLYSRASLVQQELGVTTEELLNFTDKVALSLRLSGQSASEASGALLQLSQALGNGIVQAEEYNSLIDGAPLLLRAVAAGMEEAGGSVAKLTRLVKSQQVSSQAFFRAFEAGSYILEEKLSGATLTVGQRFQRFSNTLVDTAREFNKNADAAAIVGRELDDLAGFITDVANAAIAGQKWLNQYTDGLGDLGSAAHKAGEQFRELLGLPNIGEKFGINKILGTDGTKPGSDTSTDDGPTDIGTVKPEPISIKDYAAAGKKGTGNSGSKRSPAQRFQSDVEQIKARTEAIRAETAALAGLNPLINDYGYALQKAAARQDLLAAAKRAGLKITPELRASIDQLAQGYASASAAANQLAESQDKIRYRAEEMRDVGREAMGGFIHDLLEGKSAADALADALGRVGDRLLDMALNDLFSGNSNIFSLLGFGGGGSSLSPLASSAIASGAVGLYASGGITREPAIFGEAGPEAAVPLPDGRRIPVDLRMPALAQRASVGASVVVHFAPQIDNRGASVEAVARTQQQLDKLKAELPAHVTQAVRKAQKSNVKLG